MPYNLKPNWYPTIIPTGAINNERTKTTANGAPRPHVPERVPRLRGPGAAPRRPRARRPLGPRRSGAIGTEHDEYVDYAQYVEHVKYGRREVRVTLVPATSAPYA